MPRRRILVVVALLFGLVALGQRTYSPNLSVGVKGGITLSQMSFSPKVDQSMLTGFIAGAVVRYAEERHVGIQAELNLQQRGWREHYEPGQDFFYKRTLTYIQLPVMTHIFFGGRRFRGFINMGPEIAYMLGSSISANFDYRNPSAVPGYPMEYRQTKQLDMAVTHRLDYGIAAGLGAEYRINRRNGVQIEGRFYYGLGNIFDSSKADWFAASRGLSIEATVAWLFRLR